MSIKKNKLLWSTGLLAVLVIAGYWSISGDSGKPTDAGNQTAADTSQTHLSDPGVTATAEGTPGASPATETPMSLIEDLFGAGDPSWAWAKVDLEAVQQQLPDNLYWEMSAPTDDPFVLEKRTQTRDHWNKMYGKVLSNTGTEAEVRDYFQWRNRLSTDNVEFTTYMLENYHQVLPERDLRLLELARTLHLARLEQLPRDLADALKRREAHQRARDAWLAGQAEFKDADKP